MIACQRNHVKRRTPSLSWTTAQKMRSEPRRMDIQGILKFAMFGEEMAQAMFDGSAHGMSVFDGSCAFSFYSLSPRKLVNAQIESELEKRSRSMREAVPVLLVWLWPNPSHQSLIMALQNRFVLSQPQVYPPKSFMFADILACLRSSDASGCAMRTVWDSTKDYAKCASLVGRLAHLYKLGLIRLYEGQDMGVAWPVCTHRNVLSSKELHRTLYPRLSDYAYCIPHKSRLDLLSHTGNASRLLSLVRATTPLLVPVDFSASLRGQALQLEPRGP
ncbi:hypothetical protein DE146DRAFT_632296 [Phaeosphaeria sp. MPI-PUGE-AT-0046c]|nr:hypothetical protein DE146DRAFT_632296 [Phaeosphaeria sp. MPI-PUGE-AT-0046c]